MATELQISPVLSVGAFRHKMFFDDRQGSPHHLCMQWEEEDACN